VRQSTQARVDHERPSNTCSVSIREEKKPVFDHVPADTLVLCTVSVRIDHKLKRNLESLTFVEEESLSLPVEELGDIFSPVRGHLHECNPEDSLRPLRRA